MGWGGVGGGGRERAESFSSEKKGDLLERGGQGKLYLNTVTPTETITFYFNEAVFEITQRY